MTKTEQRRFIRELISNVRADVLKQSPLFPEAWNGHEIRQFIADSFQEASYTLKQGSINIKDPYWGKRYRDYRNTVATMGRR